MIKIHPTTANFPGKAYSQAVSMANKMKSEWATVSYDHMQLCPQQINHLTIENTNRLVNLYPHIQFRCHANVRLYEHLHIFDASSDQNEENHTKYIDDLKSINQIIKAKAYSFHAGKSDISLLQMKDNILSLQDKLQIDVAVEGLYPSSRENLNLSSWKQYEWLLNSGLNMAIDLSHIQIIAHHEQHWDNDLLIALLESPQCLEIHVAGNDKIHDNHRKVAGNEYWLDILKKINSSAIIFTEENQIVKIRS